MMGYTADQKDALLEMISLSLPQFAGDDEAVNQAREVLCWAGVKKMSDIYNDQAFPVIESCYKVSPGFFVQVLMGVYGIWWISSKVVIF